MAKASIPQTSYAGLGAATGKTGFPTWDPGVYSFEIVSAEEKPKEVNGELVQITTAIKTVIIDVPEEEQADGRDPLSKNFTFHICIPTDETLSWREMNLNRMKGLLDACGVSVRADGFKVASLLGKQFTARLRVKAAKDEDDDDRNEIDKFREIDEAIDTETEGE